MVEQRLPVSLVARRSGVPVRTLYHFVKTGRLEAVQVRGVYRVRVADAFALAYVRKPKPRRA